MEIKDKIIITIDEPEAMQEDGDNWNQKERVDAAIGLIALVLVVLVQVHLPLTVTVVLVQVHLPRTVTVNLIDHCQLDL